MFPSQDNFARATGAILDTHTALYTDSMNAVLDAGLHAAERHAESMRTLFASATVATRQWLGALDWMTPVAQHGPHGRNPQSQPTGMSLANVSDPELSA